MNPHTSLLDSIVSFAHDLPSEPLDRLCAELEALPPEASCEHLRGVAAHLSHPHVRYAFVRLVDLAERAGPQMTPSALVWALRAASRSRDVHQRQQSLEMVWTGPNASQVPLRRTDQVLLDLIAHAEHSILIATYATYPIADVSEALSTASAMGVDISLVIESPETDAGRASFWAVQDLMRRVPGTRVFVWPLAKRVQDPQGHTGSLHAKCAIADDSAVLISSANLTERALNGNIELGLLVRGGDLPRKLADHFRRLIAIGTFVSISG